MRGAFVCETECDGGRAGQTGSVSKQTVTHTHTHTSESSPATGLLGEPHGERVQVWSRFVRCVNIMQHWPRHRPSDDTHLFCCKFSVYEAAVSCQNHNQLKMMLVRI